MSAEARPADQPPSTSGLAFRVSRLRWPEWVVGISGLLLLILLFAPTWYTVPNPAVASGGVSGVIPPGLANLSLNGWDGLAHAHWLLLVTIIAALALFVLQATSRSPAGPVTFSWLVFVLGILSTLWLIIRVPIKPPGSAQAAAWVALVTSAVLTVAGLRSFATEGLAPEDAPEIRPVTLSEMATAPPERQAVASESATGGPQPADRS